MFFSFDRRNDGRDNLNNCFCEIHLISRKHWNIFREKRSYNIITRHRTKEKATAGWHNIRQIVYHGKYYYYYFFLTSKTHTRSNDVGVYIIRVKSSVKWNLLISFKYTHTYIETGHTRGCPGARSNGWTSMVWGSYNRQV